VLIEYKTLRYYVLRDDSGDFHVPPSSMWSKRGLGGLLIDPPLTALYRALT
jgi:hypothetical protein